jgi:hypothetical protein
MASNLASNARISARSSALGSGILAMFMFTLADWFHPCSCAALLTTSFSLAETLTTSSPSRSARLTLAFRVAVDNPTRQRRAIKYRFAQRSPPAGHAFRWRPDAICHVLPRRLCDAPGLRSALCRVAWLHSSARADGDKIFRKRSGGYACNGEGAASHPEIAGTGCATIGSWHERKHY